MKYNRAHNVDKTSMHLLRHNFAKQFMDNGGNVLLLREILDHASLDMTAHYVDYADDLKKGLQYTPLEISNFKESKKGIDMENVGQILAGLIKNLDIDMIMSLIQNNNKHA